MKRCSDNRLKSLIRKALLAIEDPEKNILLDDFDLRYREREAKREADSARHYYRDKTPFASTAARTAMNPPGPRTAGRARRPPSG